MFKKVMALKKEIGGPDKIIYSNAVVTKGKLSDGKETVRLAVELKLRMPFVETIYLHGVVIPPKGTSDGFHEALDSADLSIALENTKTLWQRVVELISADNSLLVRPEVICENIDSWGGWIEYGAQAALAVREMVFKLSSQYQKISLEEAKHYAYRSVGGLNEMAFAIPQSVMLSAAKHGNGIRDLEVPEDRPWDASVSKEVKGLPWQEWMVQLTFVNSPRELLDAGEQFHDILYWLLRERGDKVEKLSKEGGMTVTKTKTPYEIISLYKEAVRRLGQRLGRDLELGRDVHLAIDGATTECYFPDKYIYSIADQNALPDGQISENKIILNREQHWRYTEKVRENKGKLADFYTLGTYHTVFSVDEAKVFEEFLKEMTADQAFLTSLPVKLSPEDINFSEREIKDTELHSEGYKKYALTSFMQAMLARHLINSQGPVFSSIEDIMAEDDWPGYLLAFCILDDVQLVGDDFWVTNPARMIRFYRMAFDHIQTLSEAAQKKVCTRFQFVPLIKENQVADPWKAILMIVLSEHVHYLLHEGQFEFVRSVIMKPFDINSIQGIKEMIAELNLKVREIGEPKKPQIYAVVSHRSKSFGTDVDIALGLATGSTCKIGAISSGLPILEWLDPVDPYDPALLTRYHKYNYAQNAVEDLHNKTVFNKNSVPGAIDTNEFFLE